MSELAEAVMSGEVVLERRAYDPPRICPLCGRRMVVRIDIMDWTATCSRHGELRSEWIED